MEENISCCNLNSFYFKNADPDTQKPVEGKKIFFCFLKFSCYVSRMLLSNLGKLSYEKISNNVDEGLAHVTGHL